MTLRTSLPNRCKHCKVRMPADKAHHVIHNDCIEPWCAIRDAKKALKAAKEKRVAAVLDRRLTKEKLQTLKGRGYFLAKAKKAIQKARRLEELAKGRGCMSCGRTQQQVTGGDAWKPGGFWDGGHFLGKGAHPELALEPKNIWLQCKTCNGGSGKYARKSHTVNQSFRANLIDCEGLALVEWLEGPHALKHYTEDQIKAIDATYTAQAREILKATA